MYTPRHYADYHLLQTLRRSAGGARAQLIAASQQYEVARQRYEMAQEEAKIAENELRENLGSNYGKLIAAYRELDNFERECYGRTKTMEMMGEVDTPEEQAKRHAEHVRILDKIRAIETQPQ